MAPQHDPLRRIARRPRIHRPPPRRAAGPSRSDGRSSPYSRGRTPREARPRWRSMHGGDRRGSRSFRHCHGNRSPGHARVAAARARRSAARRRSSPARPLRPRETPPTRARPAGAAENRAAALEYVEHDKAGDIAGEDQRDDPEECAHWRDLVQIRSWDAIALLRHCDQCHCDQRHCDHRWRNGAFACCVR